MTQSGFDDEILMAYADGEADTDTARRIEAAMATDGTLADRVARFSASRQSVKAAFEGDVATPVPEALLAAIRQAGELPGNVVSLDRARAVPENRLPARPVIWPTALAASLALAVGLGAGWFARGGPGGAPAMQLAGLDQPDLPGHLSRVPSGGEVTLADGARLRLIASFEDGAGRFCREMEQDGTDGRTLVAVSCAERGDWALVFAVAAGASGGFAPASSLDTLDAWLATIGAGQPLDADAEAARLRALAAP